MTPANDHGQEHSEQVFLHAVRALPPDEAAAVDARLATCADCREELRALGPVIDAFVSWPTDVLRPSASLGERLALRIAADTGTEPVRPAPERWTESQWKDVAPGIACKLLATDAEKNRVSMLVRLAPGTDYPPHRHAGVEELYMLDGVLIVDDQTFSPGDYRRGDPDTVDHRVWSETGCTCVLITSYRDEIL
jgi:ChrR Cupin-like domain